MNAAEPTQGKDRKITRRTANPQDSKSVLGLVETSLDDDKAQDVVVIDLIGKTSLCDYMVLASGTSARQVVAMSDHLTRNLKSIGYSAVPTEGKEQGDWVLLDAGDVLIHLFRPDVRKFYDLEKMWNSITPEISVTEAVAKASADAQDSAAAG